MFKAKKALQPKDYKMKPLPPANRRQRGGPAFHEEESSTVAMMEPEPDPEAQLTAEEALARLDVTTDEKVEEGDNSYCPECYLPLHPDPKPEKLYIFLHALRYTTSLGSFETKMPEWAAEGWVWDRG